MPLLSFTLRMSSMAWSNRWHAKGLTYPPWKPVTMEKTEGKSREVIYKTQSLDGYIFHRNLNCTLLKIFISKDIINFWLLHLLGYFKTFISHNSWHGENILHHYMAVHLSNSMHLWHFCIKYFILFCHTLVFFVPNLHPKFLFFIVFTYFCLFQVFILIPGS